MIKKDSKSTSLGHLREPELFGTAPVAALEVFPEDLKGKKWG
jgi:hypothetical protein